MKIQRSDLAGGFLAALIGLPQAIVLGIVVFSPLNSAEAIEQGVRAGLLAVVIGGIVAALAGGAPLLVTGPRASASLILAGLVKELAEHFSAAGPSVPVDLLAWLALCVLLAGLLQLGLAGLRADQLIRRIPEPVAAVFTLIIGIITALDQLRPLLTGEYGRRPTLFELPEMLMQAHMGALLVGLPTLGVILLLTYYPPVAERKIRIGRRTLTCAGTAPLIGLLAGIALFQLIQAAALPGPGKILADAAHLGQIEGYFAHALNIIPHWDGKIALTVLTHAALLALIGTLDTLIAAANLEARFDSPFRARRELAGQGLANVLSALAGGIAVVGSLQRGQASAELGARHASAGLASAVFILLMVTVAWPAVGHIPLGALAAMLAATGIQMIVANARFGVDWRHLRQRPSRADAVTNLLTAAVMLIPVLLLGAKLIWVTLAGLLVNIGGLLYKLSRKTVFRVYTRRERRSTELRSPENRKRLDESGCEVKIMELEGDLFFGTAIDLREQIEAEYPKSATPPAGCRYLILDFSRVHEMDDTGTRMLAQTIGRLKKRNVEVWLSYVSAEAGCLNRLAALRRGGVAKDCPETHWQEDTDHALEAIEDKILAHHADEWKRELEFGELLFCAGLAAADVAALENHFEAPVRYEKGQTIFAQGEAADGLFIIRSGDVKLLTHSPPNAVKRIAELNPGAMFGSDLLHPHHPSRVASAIARETCTCWRIDSAALVALERERPELALPIYRAAAAEFSDRIAALAREAGMVDA